MYSNKILVVDDETSYLELIKGLLEDEGYPQVVTENNPLNVLSLIEKEDIDLILLDIYMPQMNGLNLLEKIYAQHPTIPVIVVTAVTKFRLPSKPLS